MIATDADRATAALTAARDLVTGYLAEIPEGRSLVTVGDHVDILLDILQALRAGLGDE